MKINKKKIIFWSVCFLVVLTPLFMFLAWYFSTPTKMEILIIDKTVFNERREEHGSLNWVLNYEKYTKKNELLYKKNSDYFGFFPGKNGHYSINDFENKSLKNIDSIVDSNDVIFYNDAYGVYSKEWYHLKKSRERSKKIYGGATEKEALLLKKAKDSKKLIITEFNLLASPTSKKVRSSIEEEFKFKWSGWVGRYYSVLDTLKNKDLPNWLKEGYLKQHNNKWNFKASGIILVSEDGIVEILDSQKQLTNENLMILTNKNRQNEYDLPAAIKYNFWFDIITSSNANEVISYYNISTTASGDSLLSKYKIPKTFPAVIKSTDNRFYYFAGDFSDNKISDYSCYFKGISFFKSFYIDDKDKTARQYFFWDYYKPLITTILDKESVNVQLRDKLLKG